MELSGNFTYFSSHLGLPNSVLVHFLCKTTNEPFTTSFEVIMRQNIHINEIVSLFIWSFIQWLFFTKYNNISTIAPFLSTYYISGLNICTLPALSYTNLYRVDEKTLVWAVQVTCPDLILYKYLLFLSLHI